MFCPLIAAYSVDPSGEYVVWPTRAEWPFTVGIETVVGVPSVPSALTGNRAQAVLLRKPEELAVRRVRRAFLTDGAVGQPLVDRGCGADRPDELVARQVEDLQDHRLVGAGGREEAPVRADRRAHELAELGEQTVTERLDDLVVGDLDPVGVLGADLVVAEHLCRGVGHPRAGEDDELSRRARRCGVGTCPCRRPRDGLSRLVGVVV